MVKSMLKSVGYVLLVGCMGISLYAINLFLMKPYSIDHYLAKELALDTLDSPETMTYVGVFDDYNFDGNTLLEYFELSKTNQREYEKVKVAVSDIENISKQIIKVGK